MSDHDGLSVPVFGEPGGGGPPVHVELPPLVTQLPPLLDPVGGPIGGPIPQGIPVTQQPSVVPVPVPHYVPTEAESAAYSQLGGAFIPEHAVLHDAYEWVADQARHLDASEWFHLNRAEVRRRYPDIRRELEQYVYHIENPLAASVPTPPNTISVGINPQAQTVAVAGQLPLGEDIVPNIAGLGPYGQLGAATGGLFGDIFQTDQSWDQWGAGLGTIADILAVTGVIPSGRPGPSWTGLPQPPQATVPQFNPAAPPMPLPPIVPPIGQQPYVAPNVSPYQPGAMQLPYNMTSPTAMPGGAPLYQQAFVGLPGIDIVGEGAQVITPRVTPGGVRWPSRKDVPTRSGYTTYKNMGPPVAFAGDFAAVKRVKKLATRARRALGGRR